MSKLVDVIEVEFAEPHRRRVMETGLTEKNAEAFINMAILRRGCVTHFYTTQPSKAPESPADERERRGRAKPA